jgi:hypothetical protein
MSYVKQNTAAGGGILGSENYNYSIPSDTFYPMM